MATIVEIIKVLEQLAPVPYQEDYDNSGLIVGNISTEVKSILVCLDTTEEVIAEAIQLGANLIIAHHPILFKGLKKNNRKNLCRKGFNSSHTKRYSNLCHSYQFRQCSTFWSL